MGDFELAPRLDTTGNVAENFLTFRIRFKRFAMETGLEDRQPKEQTKQLLDLIGPEAREVYNRFTFTRPEDKYNCEIIMDKLGGYYNSETTEMLERYVFGSRVQKEGELFDGFYADLVHKINRCHFGDCRDSRLLDQIVHGVREDHFRTLLFQEEDLTLEKAVTICRAAEEAMFSNRIQAE